MSVRQAQACIDAREFEEWMAYATLEPFDETRADLRAGIIASTFANIHRGKDTPAYSASDFMPQYDRQSEDEVDADALIAQQQQLLETLTRAAGGTVH